MGVGKGIRGGLGHRNRKGENELKRCRELGRKGEREEEGRKKGVGKQ